MLRVLARSGASDPNNTGSDFFARSMLGGYSLGVAALQRTRSCVEHDGLLAILDENEKQI